MTVKNLQAATGGRPLRALMLLRYAIEFIASCAISTWTRARFVINLWKPVSPGSQREIGWQREFGQRCEISWQSEFGVGSKPAGRRLRPQFRGPRREALAVSVAGCLGVFVGVAGDDRHRDVLMGDVNWAVAA
jgi:hypothetical protein